MPPAWIAEEKTRKEGTPRLQQTDELSWTTGSTFALGQIICDTSAVDVFGLARVAYDSSKAG
jgi:hypothetical protein